MVVESVAPRLAFQLGEKAALGGQVITVEIARRILEMTEVELKGSNRNLKSVKQLNQELEEQLTQLRHQYKGKRCAS